MIDVSPSEVDYTVTVRRPGRGVIARGITSEFAPMAISLGAVRTIETIHEVTYNN